MDVKGSVQIKNGIFYTVISYKDKEGNWKYKWKTTKLPVRGNKKKAEEILNKEIEEYQKQDDNVDDKEILFSDFILFWLSIQKKKIQVTTYDGYLHMIKKHIQPYFEHKKILLKDIKPFDIQKYYNVKLEEGLSSNTVIKHHAIIRTSLQYAVKSKSIKENVADFVEKPQKEEKEANYYNKDELKKLLQASRGDTIEVPILLAMNLGLRRSEVLGVRWSNIDFDEKIIRIHHKIVRTFDDDGKLTISAQDKMKNKKSFRTMPISDSMVTILKNVKTQQLKNRLMYGNCYNLDYVDYVCVNELGELLKPDYITSRFKKIIKKNNFKPLNFHGLRHSCATLLLSLDYQMKDIQEYLGHADFTTTAKTYAHVDFARKNSMTNGIDGVLNF